MRRRVVRTLFLIPLLLAAGAWLVSGFYRFDLDYLHSTRGFGCSAEQGALTIIYGDHGSYALSGLFYGVNPVSPHRFWPPYTNSAFITHFLGFEFSNFGRGYLAFNLQIPYWFPTVFALLAFLRAWRKTRRETNRHSFPVEAMARE